MVEPRWRHAGQPTRELEGLWVRELKRRSAVKSFQALYSIGKAIAQSPPRTGIEEAFTERDTAPLNLALGRPSIQAFDILPQLINLSLHHLLQMIDVAEDAISRCLFRFFSMDYALQLLFRLEHDRRYFADFFVLMPAAVHQHHFLRTTVAEFNAVRKK